MTLINGGTLVSEGPVLLATTLNPPVRRGLLGRPRLVTRLRPTERRLTLLNAPASWGKTSLLADWHAAGADGAAVAWLARDSGDNVAATVAHLLLGVMCFWRGDLSAARRPLGEAVRLADAAPHAGRNLRPGLSGHRRTMRCRRDSSASAREIIDQVSSVSARLSGPGGDGSGLAAFHAAQHRHPRVLHDVLGDLSTPGHSTGDAEHQRCATADQREVGVLAPGPQGLDQRRVSVAMESHR